MKTIANVLGWVLTIYILLFVATFMLYMGCTSDGHGAKECTDNTMTKVVTYPLRPIFK